MEGLLGFVVLKEKLVDIFFLICLLDGEWVNMKVGGFKEEKNIEFIILVKF